MIALPGTKVTMHRRTGGQPEQPGKGDGNEEVGRVGLEPTTDDPDPAVRDQAVREAAEIVQAAYREVAGG
jgi:hypothetical protein